MGSAAALSCVFLSADALQVGRAAALSDFYGGSADLRQGFYQLTWPEMGSWFGFDFPEPAEAFDTDEVYDDGAKCMVRVAPGTMVYAMHQGVLPGWSWSLFFCDAITRGALVVGIGRALSVPPCEVASFPRALARAGSSQRRAWTTGTSQPSTAS